jgi:site-specific recombinase XerD
MLSATSPAPETAIVAASAGAAENLDAAFARFLRLDVANGDASPDTIRGYRSQLAAWVNWCAEHAVDAKTATVDDVKRYREDLVGHGRQATTIAHKLNVLRRVYAAAVAAGLRVDNPATGVRAPRDRRAPEDFGYLSEVELALLFRAVPHDQELKHLRDRALLGLLGIQALRTVEITRANVADLQPHGDSWALLVHGKYHDRLVFLRPDVADAVRAYLVARGTIAPDKLGEALIVADGNFARGHRLSRRGVRHVVDGYLRAANVKRPQVSNHALRHTSATLAYRYTHDLRAVQDMLGHQDPKTTARYARVVDRARTNPALKVPVEL